MFMVYRFLFRIRKNNEKTTSDYHLRYNLSNMIINDNLQKLKSNARQYQQDAVEAWANNNYKGLYVMATGTGKTYTTFLSLLKLWEAKGRSFTVIVCPFVHLVEQWDSVANGFGLKPVPCSAKYPDWKEKFKQKISLYNRGIDDNPILIMTISSFNLAITQELIKTIKTNRFLIIDEAHYAGSVGLSKNLLDLYEYRLGLTATPKRYLDDDGTDRLMEFFTKEVFVYELADAIRDGYLTKYEYYPIKTYMNEVEFEEYIDLTRKILKFNVNHLDPEEQSIYERLLMKRAKVVQNVEHKLVVVKELMSKMKDQHNILVYCGATNEAETNGSQIDKVCFILGNDLDMKIAKYTYDESFREREKILELYKEDKILQAIVAIKCLDEGIDIPSVDKAIIVSSTSNPKEYIQRRGRILRKYPNKEKAIIYDLVVLPPESISSVVNQFAADSLVNKELRRVNEFSDLALNRSLSEQFISTIEKKYNVQKKGDIHE